MSELETWATKLGKHYAVFEPLSGFSAYSAFFSADFHCLFLSLT